MGKILNTTYQDTVEKVTGFVENLINQPFYLYNDKKPTSCIYYNINKDFSSLDPGSQLEMDNNGSDCPFRFNRIYDMLLFGLPKIELNTDTDEFGLEANKIEGECYILPNTIIPTEGDYFEINYVKDSTWLFIVKDVQRDTLDNGSNAYKISYKLEYTNHDKILQNIVYNFRMIEVREGTNIAKIVRCEDYDIAKIMDKMAVALKGYYIDLFYDEKVQTFIYIPYEQCRTYDPYLIEFLIRNQILNNGEHAEYIFVDHKITPNKTFTIDYDQSVFRQFELNDKEKLLTADHVAFLELIKAFGTIFDTRFEDYFKCQYDANSISRFTYNVSCMSDDFIYQIQDNKLEEDPRVLWKNIIIKYFNNMQDLTTDELDSLKYLDFRDAEFAYYTIPFLIFCLEKYIVKTLK